MTLAMLSGLGSNISASFCTSPSRYFRDMIEMILFVESDTKIDASFIICDVFLCQNWKCSKNTFIKSSISAPVQPG